MSIMFSNSAIFYYLLGICVFTQQRHIRSFRGTSSGFYSALTIFCTIGLLSSLIFLPLYGIETTWWAPFAVLGISIVIGSIVQGILSYFIPELYLSLFGFIGIPLFGFLMFYFMYS